MTDRAPKSRAVKRERQAVVPGPTLSDLLPVDDIAMMIRGVQRYCQRNGIPPEHRTQMVTAMLNQRIEAQPQYDEDGALCGHLVEGPTERLLSMAREVLTDYLDVLEVKGDRPIRLV